MNEANQKSASYFRVAFYFGIQGYPNAQPFTWKWFWFARKVVQQDSFWSRGKSNSEFVYRMTIFPCLDKGVVPDKANLAITNRHIGKVLKLAVRPVLRMIWISLHVTSGRVNQRQMIYIEKVRSASRLMLASKRMTHPFSPTLGTTSRYPPSCKGELMYEKFSPLLVTR